MENVCNKHKGRPLGSGRGNCKMLRVLISTRQEMIIGNICHIRSLSISEVVRRALDSFLEVETKKLGISVPPAKTVNV